MSTYSKESQMCGMTVADVISPWETFPGFGKGSISDELFRYSGCVPVWPKLMMLTFKPTGQLLQNITTD